MNKREQKEFKIIKQALTLVPQLDINKIKEIKEKEKERLFLDIPFTIPAATGTYFRWNYEAGTIVAVSYNKKTFGEDRRQFIELFR